ncbi:MAG: cytochrome c oxidase assembly protein [Acidimicrobiia bacterium]|nr:cytochrome c oxidase assembly protein [Acidimicrobiia bacterium]
MSWWCSSSRQTWTWAPKPYLGALLIVAGVLAVAGWWLIRGRHTDAMVEARAASLSAGDTGLTTAGSTNEGTGTGRSVALLCGVLGLWACLDWPLASLGAGYLATAQMMRQILMVMVVAPLLLFATPAPLAARAVGWGKRLSVLRAMSRPAFAVPVAALTLVAVNAPAVVDPLVKTPYGAFAIDAAWVCAGFALWLPVQCPHPGVRRLTGGAAVAYLIGQSIVPVLPGFFMTWADFPIYSTYELAPRVFQGFDAVTDQQTAAAVLQVGGMVLLWIQISYRFLKWGYQQMEEGSPRRKPIPGAGTLTP